MVLDRLESGLLLLRTPQGYVALRPSFWQRAYLIWTFRNFRELSPPLLNARQLALVKALANNTADFAPHSYDRLLVIGTVDFSTSGLKTHAPTSSLNNAEPAREEHPRREVEAERTAISGTLSSKRPYRPETSQSERPKSTQSKHAISPVKVAAGVALLCTGFLVAAHRIGSGVGSLAHNPPAPSSNLAVPPSTPKTAETTIVAKIAPSTPVAATTSFSATSHLVAGPEAAVDLATVRTAATISPLSGPKRSLPLRQEERRAKATTLFVQDVPILATRPPLRFEYPAYPDTGARGEVAMMAEVNSDGTVRSVSVVSGNRALAAVAVRAVRKWRYPPYLKDGEPVATETNIVVSFFSDDAVSMSFPPTLTARR